MTSRIIALTIDCDDVQKVAAFWSGALGGEVRTDADGDVVFTPTGTPFELLFQHVPEPKVGQNDRHFDLSTTSAEDKAAFIEKLLALGAQHIDIGQGPEDTHVVLADPEGNELCVLEPGNSFVTYDSRLGSITCNGSRDVGVFWSEVLGWPLIWDQDGETAVRSPDGTGPFITWGPPVSDRDGKARWHLDIAPPADVDRQAEVDRLLALGATRADIGQTGDESWVVLADPDGQELCVLRPR